MTPPIVVQHVICQFFNEWYSGLRPKLVIETKDNGAIVVSSTIVIDQQHHRHRSGHASRQRRKAARAAHAEKKFDSNSTQTDEVLDNNDETQVLQSVHSLDNLQCHVDKAVQAVMITVDAACDAQPLLSPQKPVLSTVINASVSIPPRPLYHPAIHNVARTMFNKHPGELLEEEIVKLNSYCDWKRDCGEPVETDIIHLPSSMRDCLHCGHPPSRRLEIGTTSSSYLIVYIICIIDKDVNIDR